MAAKRFKLGDDEVLSFGFDWSDWLTNESAGIASSAWTVPAELTVVAEAQSPTGTTVTLQNDTGEAGDTYLVTNIITTDNVQPLTAERSFVIQVVEAKYR
jgi:hypothetical protein